MVLVSIVGDLGILADVFQVTANETEWFYMGTSFQLVDLFDGCLVEEVAADSIIGVRG